MNMSIINFSFKLKLGYVFSSVLQSGGFHIFIYYFHIYKVVVLSIFEIEMGL